MAANPPISFRGGTEGWSSSREPTYPFPNQVYCRDLAAVGHNYRHTLRCSVDDALMTSYCFEMPSVRERDVNNTPTVSYTRGNDLSGSIEGAGGIGGLLARSDGYSSGNFTTHNFYFADGNGNVTYMLNSSQSMVASYRYAPFGSTISSSGTLATANVYRFSSKEIHANSGMYYYGYRFYDPNLQRWINRDPLRELGHRVARRVCASCYEVDSGDADLYTFCRNEPVSSNDPFGLMTRQECDDQYKKDMNAVKSAGAACLTSAGKWGLIGEVILGGGGLAVGGVAGGPPGAGIGLFCGTVANGIIDMFHYSHCMNKVNNMRKAAEAKYKNCLDNADGE